MLSAAYLGWNYVSFTHGELPVTTSWVEQQDERSSGLTHLRIATVDRSGVPEGTLQADADIFRTGPNDIDLRRDGEVFVDFRYRFTQPPEAASQPVTCGPVSRDLTGARIRVDFRVEASLYGPSSAPNGVQILMKTLDEDGGWEEPWRSYYGGWTDAAPGWQTMELDLAHDSADWVEAGFDVSKVALLGIKIGTNRWATGSFQGQIDVANVRIEYPDGTASEYDFENVEDSISRMAKTGATTVALVDHWFVQDLAAADIHPDPRVTHQYPGSPDASIDETIRRLHAEGLQVHLKPHLDVANFSYDEELDEWRGKIEPPLDKVDDFFASYEAFIDYYADIAQRTKAEVLVVETELNVLDGSAAYRNHWERIISSIREIYTGNLAVAVNWDNYRNHSFLDLVDIVGIDAYFPLTDLVNPSQEDLRDAWQTWASDIAAWSATLGKPFYFTEFGIQSRNGAATAPGSVCDSGAAQFNASLQVAHYDAALEVFSENEHFAGLLGWAWFPWSDAGGLADIDFTPQNKQLESEAPRLFWPWHHWDNPCDVDANGRVEPLDVLIGINHINSHLGDNSLPGYRTEDKPYFDVVRDGICTPLDVLRVINCINSGIPGEGEETQLPLGVLFAEVLAFPRPESSAVSSRRSAENSSGVPASTSAAADGTGMMLVWPGNDTNTHGPAGHSEGRRGLSTNSRRESDALPDLITACSNLLALLADLEAAVP